MPPPMMRTSVSIVTGGHLGGAGRWLSRRRLRVCWGKGDTINDRVQTRPEARLLLLPQQNDDDPDQPAHPEEANQGDPPVGADEPAHDRSQEAAQNDPRGVTRSDDLAAAKSRDVRGAVAQLAE